MQIDQGLEARSVPLAPRVSRRVRPGTILLPLIGLALAIVAVFPVLYMFSVSLMPPDQVGVTPLQLIPRALRLRNFVDIFAQFNIGHYLLNSIWVAGCVVLLNLFFCSLTGYSLAKFRFPGQKLIFGFILSTIMIPFNVIIVPLYVVIRSLGWINTPQALIAPFAISAFGVFLMRQFIADIPDEYIDAARVDGAHEFGIYRRIVVPLSKPALMTLAILIFVDNWDQFLWPLIVLNADTWKTMPLGLAQFLSEYGSSWNLLMAAAVLATLPVLLVFVVMQRGFMQGFSGLAGLKG